MRRLNPFSKNRSIRVGASQGVLPPGHRQAVSVRAWMVWLVSLCFVLFQFFLQLSSAEMIGGLMKSFSLNAAGGSLLAGSYYYIYVLLQSPAGMLIDRYGPRRVLSAGALLVMVGCAMFAVAPSVALAVIGRLLMGTGAAFAFVGSLNLISKWFPANRFGLMTALVETFGMFGSILGTLLLVLAINSFGWRECMGVAGGMSLVLAGLLWWIVRDAPDNVTAITATSYARWWADIKTLMKQSHVWLNGIYSGFLFLMITIFVALWSVPFLQATYHLSLLQATELADIVFVGVAIAGPLIGWLDSKLVRRQGLMVVCPLIAACLMAVVVFMPNLSQFEIGALLLCFGFALSVYVLTFVIGNELATPSSRTTSLGFVNAMAVGTAPLFGPVVGYLLDHPIVWSGPHVVSVVLPYQEAFTFLMAGLVVASIIGYFLPSRPDWEAEVQQASAEEHETDDSVPELSTAE